MNCGRRLFTNIFLDGNTEYYFNSSNQGLKSAEAIVDEIDHRVERSRESVVSRARLFFSPSLCTRSLSRTLISHRETMPPPKVSGYANAFAPTASVRARAGSQRTEAVALVYIM